MATAPRNMTAAEIRNAEKSAQRVNEARGMSPRDAMVAANRSVSRQIEADQLAAYDDED